MKMAEIVYGLCAVTSLVCAVMLIRQFRRRPVRLLLWSSLCFAGLAVNNVLLFVDFMVGAQYDLSTWRTGIGLGAMIVLVIGLVGEVQ
jgi:hypothetical protein